MTVLLIALGLSGTASAQVALEPYFRLGLGTHLNAGPGGGHDAGSGGIDTDNDGSTDDQDADDDNDGIPDIEDPDSNGNGVPDVQENHIPGGSIGFTVSSPFPAWAEVGSTFGATLSATGGTGSYTFGHTGSLPSGLSISGSALSGTYTVPGVFDFSLTASDSDGVGPDATKGPFSIDVWNPMSIVGYPSGTVSYPVTVGQNYSLPAPTIHDAAPGVSYTLDGGGGAASINPSTGIVTLSPTAPGPIGPLTVRAQDGLGRPWSSDPFTIGAADPVSIDFGSNHYHYRVGIAAATPEPIISGGWGDKAIAVTGGTSPYGMPMIGSGAFWGTPSASCSACSVTVTATDVDGRNASSTLNYTIVPALTVTHDVTGPLNWRVGKPIVPITVTAANHGETLFEIIKPPSNDSYLPDGLSMEPSTGTISGTPTQTGSGTNVVIKVTDELSSSVSAPFSFTITQASITVNPPQTATQGTPVTFPATTYNDLAQTGSTPRSFTLVGAPAGMNIDASTGAITWTPSAATTTSGIQVRMIDIDGTVVLSNPFSVTAAVPSIPPADSYSPQWSARTTTATSSMVYATYPVEVEVDHASFGMRLASPSGNCWMYYQLASAPSPSGPWTTILNGSKGGTCTVAPAGTQTGNFAHFSADIAFPPETGRYFRLFKDWSGYMAYGGDNFSIH